ncbi:TPA: hypothetical protein I8Y09_002868 [Raoultella ornithinolytica]|nr:hypothetical protein [Raoultella ornithinolytica]
MNDKVINYYNVTMNHCILDAMLTANDTVLGLQKSPQARYEKSSCRQQQSHELEVYPVCLRQNDDRRQYVRQLLQKGGMNSTGGESPDLSQERVNALQDRSPDAKKPAR